MLLSLVAKLFLSCFCFRPCAISLRKIDWQSCSLLCSSLFRSGLSQDEHWRASSCRCWFCSKKDPWLMYEISFVFHAPMRKTSLLWKLMRCHWSHLTGRTTGVLEKSCFESMNTFSSCFMDAFFNYCPCTCSSGDPSCSVTQLCMVFVPNVFSFHPSPPSSFAGALASVQWLWHCRQPLIKPNSGMCACFTAACEYWKCFHLKFQSLHEQSIGIPQSLPWWGKYCALLMGLRKDP